MRYYRCKCGQRAAWSSMGIQECDGCPECNTTLEESAEDHQTPRPHEWREEFGIDKQTGATWKDRVCTFCYKRERVADVSDSPSAR